MLYYLAKCGWLFDGFFSHWQLAVESILQLTNSSHSSESDQRSFRKRRGLGPGGPGGPALRKSFDRSLNRLNSPIEGWIRRPTAHWRRIHRMTNQIFNKLLSFLWGAYFQRWVLGFLALLALFALFTITIYTIFTLFALF